MAAGDFDKSQATLGYGKKLEFADAANGTGTKIGGTTEISLPESELDAAEITNDDSPNATKEYIPGMVDPGTASFKYKYSKAGYATVQTLYASRAVKYFTVTLKDLSKATFQGFITKNTLGAELEDAIEVEAEIQATGPVTFTPAA